MNTAQLPVISDTDYYHAEQTLNGGPEKPGKHPDAVIGRSTISFGSSRMWARPSEAYQPSPTASMLSYSLSLTHNLVTLCINYCPDSITGIIISRYTQLLRHHGSLYVVQSLPRLILRLLSSYSYWLSVCCYSDTYCKGKPDIFRGKQSLMKWIITHLFHHNCY